MEAIKYITSWTTWLMMIIPVGAGLMITYQAARKALNDDDSIVEDSNNKIRNTIKGSIIGLSISGIVQAIKAFY